jgi:hypothetical protein
MAVSLYQQLTSSDGTRLRLDRVASLSTGILATAFGTGLADLIRTVYLALVIKPLRGLESFVGDVSDTFTTGIEGVSEGVWRPLFELLDWFGPAAWIVAALVVLVIAFGVAKGWSLSG